MIAHVFKPRRRVNGKIEPRRTYRGRFRLAGDLAVTDIPLGTADKQVAEHKLAEIIKEKERERAGLIAPKLQRNAAQRPIKDHLADFVADLTTLGRCEIYCRQVNSRALKLVNECGWKNVGDISVDSFVAWRSRQTAFSPKTVNEYLNAVNALLNWMERQGRIASNVLGKVPRIDVRGKQQRRRAFTDDELNRLLAVAGPHRLLYLTAAYTGLRLGELRQLVWGDLILDHERPHIIARAITTKNRREAVLPLHPRLLEAFKTAKGTTTDLAQLVFTRSLNADRMIRKDLDAAGLVRIDAMGRKIDFHALRYTFATKLASSGVSQRLTQELMRHSDPRLTANIYTDVTQLPTFEAVSGLSWVEDAVGKNAPAENPSLENSCSQLRSQTAVVFSQNTASTVALAEKLIFPQGPLTEGSRPELAATGTEGNWRRGRDSNPR